MVLTNYLERVVVTVFNQIATRQLVALEALTSSQVTVLATRDGEIGKAPQVNFIRA